MKITIIYTGGTIGSKVSKGYISTDRTSSHRVMEVYRKLYADESCAVDFTEKEPLNLLSEDSDGLTLRAIGECVKAELPEVASGLQNQSEKECTSNDLSGSADGLIITHGSDTLQYTAAMLALLLEDVDIPVMVVAANYVVDDHRSNAIANFHAAIKYITDRMPAGVYVPYRNSDGVVRVHRAVSLLPHLPYSDNLYSLDDAAYFLAETDEFIPVNSNVSCDSSGIGSGNVKHAQMSCQHPSLSLPSSATSGILRITPYPGMIYPDLSGYNSGLPGYNADPFGYSSDLPGYNTDPSGYSSGLPRAVLLDTYHSGTLCSTTGNMKSFFHTLIQLEIPVFLTGACGGLDYASVRTWANFGINILPAMSPVTAYMKLWMALSVPGMTTPELLLVMGSTEYAI